MSTAMIMKTLFILTVVSLPLLFLLKPPLTVENPYGLPGKPLGFRAAVISYFKNYANFKGRASRSEFWWATLFFYCAFLIFNRIDSSETIATLFLFGTLVPNLALATRRLHDINRIGAYQFVSMAFPIGTLIATYWYCKAPSDLENHQL